VRLKSIKLSGFKSFVDPTHFELPGQLIGVVGPNGCGKSNIIDAVRWVLGESRASELRGESMLAKENQQVDLVLSSFLTTQMVELQVSGVLLLNYP
jgi:DNA repair exonuclease SbcCD ATPase subunit